MTSKIFNAAGLLISTLVAFSACGMLPAKWYSIYRKPDLSGSRSVLTDAKQRVITNLEIDPMVLDGRVYPKRIVCAEPSPDVASALSESISASVQAAVNKVSVSGQGAAALSLATAESLAQLGERLASIQLLRDKYYRACEAYGNGAISSTSYTLVLSRLDKTMATLMLGEMAAGAFGRRLASISGSAQTNVAPKLEDLKAALEAVDSARKKALEKQNNAKQKKEEFEKVRGDLNSSDAAAKKKAEDAKQASEQADREAVAAQEDLTRAQQALYERSLSATASGSAAQDIGLIGHNVSQKAVEVASHLVTLQQQLFDVTDSSTLMDACITTLDRVRVPADKVAKINEMRKKLADERERKATPQKLESLRTDVNALINELESSQLGAVCLQKFDELISQLDKARETTERKANVTVEAQRAKLCERLVERAASTNEGKDIELAQRCAGEVFPKK